MVIAFSNLYTESSLKSVNDHLSGKTFISGDQLIKDDIKVYGEILEQPSSDSYPNASKCQTAPAIAAPAKEAVKTSDDDIDLFGEETKDKKKAGEAREATKASTKKKKSGKSSVLIDFKPWDDETKET
ncbi:hypothetical protein T459_25203 [Capsicum annuum]|uniref:Uncharacterized protein n=1 Tax=Capsicum annuum TaxID=4072 RepID=A0A2G2YK47_CAPAN|nr:hypothetical protein T459_25203 [Capsicum annuum]